MTGADLYARAVIAAARAYGDDPVTACIGPGRYDRRALVAAVSALARLPGRTVTRIEAQLGIGKNCVFAARHQRNAPFLKAETAAARALDFAGWRPASVPEPAREEAPLPPTSTRRVLSAGRLRREILTVLGEDPSTVPELAQLIGVTEAAVRQVIMGLRDDGEVQATTLTAEGWRVQTWRVIG